MSVFTSGLIDDVKTVTQLATIPPETSVQTNTNVRGKGYSGWSGDPGNSHIHTSRATIITEGEEQV